VVDRSSREPAVAVFGASGHTGRFAVAELLRRGMSPIAVGRDHAKLIRCGFVERGVDVHEASVSDPLSLARAFDGAAAVVNCAGPFLDTAAAVASAALGVGAHYLDVTAEQASAQQTFEALDHVARRSRLLVVPAMGFFGGLGDLLATVALDDWDAADEIRIGIALSSWYPTRGTRLTGRRNTARRVVVSGGQIVPAPTSAVEAVEMEWDFSPPFTRQRVVQVPFSEVVLIARHIRVTELRTYLSSNALEDIRDPTTPLPQPSDASGRSAQRFSLEAQVRRGDQIRRVAVQGRDIYALSAALVSAAVQQILEGDERAIGAQAPGAILDAESVLMAAGVELQGAGDWHQ
jgi:NAD(P)-dependent dehydrogenase (short-subunit alcohol dehydrogenase family)